MTRILIEEDHFLKIVPVILDPEIPEAHRQAVADFFAHDVPDFAGWCRELRARIPGLYPAEIVWAADQDDFEAKLADADGAIVETFAVRREALAAAKRLAVVQKFGVMAGNVDAAACAQRGIEVRTIRRRVNIAVAEHALALMLALAKKLHEVEGLVDAASLTAAGHRIRPGDRRYVGYSNYAGIRGLKTLFGATLGIVGLGEIGREVASRAAAFGMKMLYTQRNRADGATEAALDARYASLDDVMAQSDYLLIQLPLNKSTRGLISRKVLARTRTGAVLINVARAELVDHDALIEALDCGRLAGLALDVGYSEPFEPDEPLLRYKGGNVLLTPHIAIGARQNALADLEEVCSNLWRALTSSQRR
jgi:phosphoglycerate dehydrogenase-like enzyme